MIRFYNRGDLELVVVIDSDHTARFGIVGGYRPRSYSTILQVSSIIDP